MAYSTDNIILCLKYFSLFVFYAYCGLVFFRFWFETVGVLRGEFHHYVDESVRVPGEFSQCAARISIRGFAGNPDFYGLGIRIGVYLQWLASLIANVWLPKERGYVAATYVLFSISLLVALAMLMFDRACAFTAEIIIILNILWGGTWLVDLTVSRRLGKNRNTQGLHWARFAYNVPTWFVTAWFWTRMASLNEGEYAPTPGGTSFFLITRVEPENVGPASVFMAVCCVLVIFSCINFVVAWVFPGKTSHIAQLFSMFTVERLRILYCKAFTWLLRLFGRPVARVFGWSEHFNKLASDEARLEEWQSASIGLTILVLSILSVELTLIWNFVTGVYEVRSTGQVIPLVGGSGLLINTFWKLIHKEKASFSSATQTTFTTQLEGGDGEEGLNGVEVADKENAL